MTKNVRFLKDLTAELTDEQLRKLGYDARIESVEEARRASNFNLR